MMKDKGESCKKAQVKELFSFFCEVAKLSPLPTANFLYINKNFLQS